MITTQQIKERLSGVGASDSPIIAGYSKFMSARELYHIKRGEIESKESGERADIGNIIEDAIAQIFTMKTGKATRKSNQTIYHPDYPFLFCHLDRTIPAGWGYPPGTPLELKNSSQSKEWGPEDAGRDGVPIDYLIQVQHQMACCKKEMALIAVLLWGNTLKIYEIPRDNEFINMIIEMDAEFWGRVKSGTPPEIQFDHSTSCDLLRRIYPGTNGKRIDLPENLMPWHDTLVSARMHRKAYDDVIQGAKAHIMLEMGESAVGMLSDGTGYTRKANKNDVVTLRHTKKP